MAVIGGIMVPHPPLIVPEVGRGQEILIKDTIKAYQEAAGMAAELKPDTIVVISPHAVMYAVQRERGKKSWTMERWSRCILSISITGITSWCESADPDCPLPTITGQAGTLP